LRAAARRVRVYRLQDPGLAKDGEMKLCGCAIFRVKSQARIETSLLRVPLLEYYRKPEIYRPARSIQATDEKLPTI